MKEFQDLIKNHRGSDTATIMSVTTVHGGYLLAVQFGWSDDSFRQDAVFVARELYGPKKGELRIGWARLVYEYVAPEKD